VGERVPGELRSGAQRESTLKIRGAVKRGEEEERFLAPNDGWRSTDGCSKGEILCDDANS
jgi:hypothetical protein